MQLIRHKNTRLTVCERLFIEKSLELLYIGSIDSYRVKLNNPKSALAELKYCLEEFQAGRIKHFHTIKAKEKGKKALIDEATLLLEYSPNYLVFNTISKDYLLKLLTSVEENNYKKVINAIDILLSENIGYLAAALNSVETLIAANNTSLEALEIIDTSLNIIFTELISGGHSKGFLYRLVYGIFVNSVSNSSNFNTHFSNFRSRILSVQSEFNVIFRIDTTQKVYESISAINNPELSLSDNINNIHLSGRQANEFRQFNVTSGQRKFIKCNLKAPDYLAALKKARSILSEYLDVINLGLSEEYLVIHSRALVIDSRSPEKGDFQNNGNILDGKYKVEKDHYLGFTKKLPAILNSSNVQNETKEKIKSAIRYLRLGNQSTEVEHKFINYWIGLEYLFSNYESQSTINRIKEHFINAHLLAYVKRNVYSFKNDFGQISTNDQKKITSYTPTDFNCLEKETFYSEIGHLLLKDYPLLGYRALKLQKWFFPQGKTPNATDYLRKHKSNLEIHFTRIYRLRNEIIHDAATNTNNEHIASNLRYYLTFILNELIDFFSRNTGKSLSIEDYFILNEIELGNIEQSGYLLPQLLNIECSIDFIS